MSRDTRTCFACSWAQRDPTPTWAPEIPPAIAWESTSCASHGTRSLRPSLKRRGYPIGSKPSRKRLLVVLAVCSGLAGFAVGPRALKAFDRNTSRTEIAKATIRAYVDQGYAAYRMVMPQRACPISISELDAFIARKNRIDPWGIPYEMYCSDTPAGRHTIVVRSAGEDAKFGTADDLWSDR